LSKQKFNQGIEMLYRFAQKKEKEMLYVEVNMDKDKIGEPCPDLMNLRSRSHIKIIKGRTK